MSETQTPSWKKWTGYVMAAVPSLLMLFSAFMKISHNPQAVDGFVNKNGFSEGVITPIGIVEVLCVVIFLIPRTAVLGAILATGYLGGAVLTHVRYGGSFVPAIACGVLFWGSLFLRDPRVAALIPLRK